MGRRATLKSLDEKIEVKKTEMYKAKEKYESLKEELAEMVKLRNERMRDEIMKAIANSDKSYDEVLEYIKGTTESDD